MQVNRNGLRAVVYGTGSSDTLSIPYLPNNADINVGDQLVSSGLGEIFPEGYPVATISSVSRNLGQAFASIKATPEAHLESSREVLLVLKAKAIVIDNSSNQLAESNSDTQSHEENQKESQLEEQVPKPAGGHSNE